MPSEKIQNSSQEDENYIENHRMDKSNIIQRCQTSHGTNRSSVRDQINELNIKCTKNHDILKEMEEKNLNEKKNINQLIFDIEKKFRNEINDIKNKHEKEMKNAMNEIERLTKLFNVQRGSVMTIQEQCSSFHKHLLHVEQDVQTLAREVLGDS